MSLKRQPATATWTRCPPVNVSISSCAPGEVMLEDHVSWIDSTRVLPASTGLALHRMTGTMRAKPGPPRRGTPARFDLGRILDVIFLRGFQVIIRASSLFLISLVGTLERILHTAGGRRGRRTPKVNGYPTFARSSSSDLRRRGRNIQGRRR
jgi:hypothetical protein